VKECNKCGAINHHSEGNSLTIPSASRSLVEAVELQFHTFLTSAPDTVERSAAYCMEAVEVQLHTFLTSALDTVERSTAHRLNSVEVQLHTF